MPVSPTYPGVYVEEIQSPVRTIVGVATAITAFVGYTRRGPLDQPIDVFNFGEFERTFGGLDANAPLTYAVQQFFLNGGGQAIIVRVARGPGLAAVELGDYTATTPKPSLVIQASSEGAWGNALRISVDRDTVNPNSLFNLSVVEETSGPAGRVLGRSEQFRNLSLSPKSGNYVVDVVDSTSALIRVATDPGRAALTKPASTSGEFVVPQGGFKVGDGEAFVIVVDDQPHRVPLNGDFANFGKVADAVKAAFNAAAIPKLSFKQNAKTISFVSTDAPDRDDGPFSIRVIPDGLSKLAERLKFGVAFGGTEVDAFTNVLPGNTGTVGDQLDDAVELKEVKAGEADLKVTVSRPGLQAVDVLVTIADVDATLTGPEAFRQALADRLRTAATKPENAAVAEELSGASVRVIDRRLVVVAGGGPATTISFANATGNTLAATLKLDNAEVRIASLSPVLGGTTYAPQRKATAGVDGDPLRAPTKGTPDSGDAELLIGSPGRTGIEALAKVDLFNLLVLPDEAGSGPSVLAAAATFCERHRAMLITDLPEYRGSVADAREWVTGSDAPKSANVAAYFPRPNIPDPLRDYRPRQMGGAGAIAGLFARTDGTRGVWKPPAGTEAGLRGPVGFSPTLTNEENGLLNPLGLNANRALPVYGNVVWGARTLVGADAMANQWKYVPVRRTALYIEESLFRGTQWVVFEPNDEPLWAQIRLNVGSFMHGLFRRGAFQGASPRQAYLVKCDSETTTQADIDLGIVNILVGFAPLKPAEFVVIKLAQLAGQLET